VQCPNGHESATGDYCDQCGAPIPNPGLPDEEDAPDTRTAPQGTPATRGPCPVCGSRPTTVDQFCEECGYDFVNQKGGVVPEHADTPDTIWEIVVHADRGYYNTLETDGIPFPADYAPRTFRIVAAQTTVGRRNEASGVHPDIDLSGDPEDTGISRRHAMFVRAGDGSLSVVDVGSANGTTLNDDVTPMAPDTPVIVTDGDCIHLGAWSTMTVRGLPAGAADDD
jgi:hypothetical protein